jgi:preprotein translocase subunit SecG
MVTFLTILHVFVCVFLIIVVLLQAGKGGGMGIAFGGGGSQTVFGSSGAGNFLTKLTSAAAFIFLITSLGLAHYSSQQDSKRLQLLGERKAQEKKAEDEKAAKLKSDLDKARESAQKTGSADKPAPNSSDLPEGAAPAPAAAGKPGELKLTAPKVGTTPEAKEPAAPAAKAPPKGAAKAPAAGEAAPKAGEAPAPKPKKKKVAPPAGEGETNAAPAAPAAEPAPAPAQ